MSLFRFCGIAYRLTMKKAVKVLADKRSCRVARRTKGYIKPWVLFRIKELKRFIIIDVELGL